MRKIIVSFCILLAAISLKAQSLNGIRIDGGNTPILVYFGGNQMCLPTTTCFVANLKVGYYTVEVYATRSTRPGERVWKGERLYNERVYFDGKGVEDIFVEERTNRPNRPRPEQGVNRPNYNRYDRVMDDQLFATFLRDIKKEAFKDERIEMIEAALINTAFTSAQCLQLVKLLNFNDEKVAVMKLMYPQIVDKEAFFTVIASLTFSTDKEEMNDFVRKYGRR